MVQSKEATADSLGGPFFSGSNGCLLCSWADLYLAPWLRSAGPGGPRRSRAPAWRGEFGRRVGVRKRCVLFVSCGRPRLCRIGRQHAGYRAKVPRRPIRCTGYAAGWGVSQRVAYVGANSGGAQWHYRPAHCRLAPCEHYGLSGGMRGARPPRRGYRQSAHVRMALGGGQLWSTRGPNETQAG